jgi:hypothetical protein
VYSAHENSGDTTQISGTTKPSMAKERTTTSNVPFLFFTIVTVRLRWPCGARIAMSRTLAAMITAFAYHGFI